jgi:hypothetical protein
LANGICAKAVRNSIVEASSAKARTRINPPISPIDADKQAFAKIGDHRKKRNRHKPAHENALLNRNGLKQNFIKASFPMNDSMLTAIKMAPKNIIR